MKWEGKGSVMETMNNPTVIWCCKHLFICFVSKWKR